MKRWKMNRAKFFNFWYYTDQEFFMESGRALFRGHNGSGKSITTQALITVLLDGNAGAKRLDPFGKTERNIRDTLLGEDDILGIDDRIGYVTMEFKKGDSEIYKTIGMGVEAHRGKKGPAKLWYFILNGRRVGNKEGYFRLYKEEKNEGKWQPVPLTDYELKEALLNEGIGQFFHDRDDYAEQVNKQLFGFESLESYQNYISLLINTRSPKLSDTTNTDRLSEVLSDSLPPISEEDFRPLFETFESIERMERDLTGYEIDLQAMMKLEASFRNYHVQALAEKAFGYKEAIIRISNLQKEKQRLTKSIADSKSKILKLSQEIDRLAYNQHSYEKEKDSLRHSEVEELQKKRRDYIKVKTEAIERQNKLNNDLKRAETIVREYQRKLEDSEYKLSKAKSESNETINEMHTLSVECYFEANDTWVQHFQNNNEHYSFTAWINENEHHRDFLNEATNNLQRHARLVEDKDLAEQAYGDMQIMVDDAEREIIRFNEELDREELALIERIQVWYYQLQELSLSPEAAQRLMAGVSKADITPHDTYTKEIQDSYNHSFRTLVESELLTQNTLQLLLSNIRKIEEEILELRNRPEMEPVITGKKRGDWSVLFQEGVPYVPFYEACEFKDGVSETTRLRIQDALSELGILSAVIVPDDKIEIAAKHTTVIFPTEKKDHNLTAYLTPAPCNVLDIALIERILEGISIDDEAEQYISEQGRFRTEWIEGRAAVLEEGQFIGKGAREALRRAKIETLEATLSDQNEEKIILEMSSKSIDERKAKLSNEMEQFPSFDDYRMLGNKKRLANDKLEILNNDLNQKCDLFKKITNEANNLFRSISASMKVYIPLNLEALSQALKAANDYLTQLQSLQITYREMQNIKERSKELSVTSERERTRADVLNDEISDEDKKIYAATQDIQNTEEALRAIGEDEVVRRLEELSKLLEEIPKTRDLMIAETSKVEVMVALLETDIAQLTENQIPFQTDIVKAWQSSLDEHRKLDVYHAEDGLDVSEMMFDDAVNYLLGELSDKHDASRNNIFRAIDDLQSSFDKQNVNLPRYSLMRQIVRSNFFDNYDLENLTDDQKELINALREKLGRIEVKADVENKRISPARACKYLDDKIEELKLQASEKDRELYEQFLMNTLRDSIRRKIHYVRNWEKEINLFLDQEDTIKFRLKWVPKQSEGEGVLNTKELVDALSRDQQWIDQNKITKHFRAKIKQAKRAYEENKEGNANLRKLIADVMDYRKWHDFELYFTKPNGSETLLNKRSVARLSGGQQVLSVVAPILAALHAKYLEANEETVRIFTLDEAFARVDDENKEVMFKYVRDLDFDYIINSQELWGTYETVPNLDIFDLARPKNRPAVSVIAYHWNGGTSVKTRIKPEEKL